MNARFRTASVLLLIFGLAACSIDVDLNAPPRDIWVVYGVLRANDTAQYIRISRGFLPESDALEYAKDNDLSAKGLLVSLSGGGRTYTAVEMDSVLKDPADGTFYPYTTLYRISTPGNLALSAGERYELEITRPDEPDFFLRSQTRIPTEVTFLRPTFTPGPGRKRCLREINLETEVEVEFTQSTAASYELRAYADYTVNGSPRMASFGPTALFEEDVRCNSSTICYKFREKEILAKFVSDVSPEFGNVYTFGVNDNNKCMDDPDNLPDDFRFEVTCMDEFLTNYRLANDPKFADLNSVRQEYTNITAPEGVDAYGILGSESRSYARARLGPCSLYHLSFNNTPRPQDCADL